MNEKKLLKEDSDFAGHKVVHKVSCHHDGEREVYLAGDANDNPVVLVVFNPRSPRYATDSAARKRQPDFIEEIRFFKENADTPGIPKYINSGIDSHCRHRYAWMTVEYAGGDSLDAQICRRGPIPLDETLQVIKSLSDTAEAVARFTKGGGHYNISTDNLLINRDSDEMRLAGFTNIGAASNGNSAIDGESLDSRFRAPETLKGIYNYRSDIYSLGMVMLAMLTGYTGDQTEDAGAGEAAENTFYTTVWKIADRMLPNSVRLILRKATDPNPAKRFSSFAKFKQFLSKIHAGGTDSESGGGRIDNRPTPLAGVLGSGSPHNRGERLSFGAKHAFAAKTGQESGSKGGLDEVAGMADLKALLRRDFIRIVRNPKIADAYGIRPSNCTLLYGPQGCGKTFIAEKAAQESGLKYKIVNPSELGSIYVHGSQQKIAELFAEAEKKGPMILILDEFDALVPKRDAEQNGNQANEVNEMLLQLNNCASRGIYVLATTNRPALLDPAIMRTGRVDRKIFVPLPDKEARAELFRLEVEKRPHADIDYDVLAAATDNYTCSDISFIVEETARQCFEETLDRGTDEPLPLSMDRLMEILKSTHSSVSEAQRKEYLDIKSKIENDPNAARRKKVGFSL